MSSGTAAAGPDPFFFAVQLLSVALYGVGVLMGLVALYALCMWARALMLRAARPRLARFARWLAWIGVVIFALVVVPVVPIMILVRSPISAAHTLVTIVIYASHLALLIAYITLLIKTRSVIAECERQARDAYAGSGERSDVR
jgi:hypothetical protein